MRGGKKFLDASVKKKNKKKTVVPGPLPQRYEYACPRNVGATSLIKEIGGKKTDLLWHRGVSGFFPRLKSFDGQQSVKRKLFFLFVLPSYKNLRSICKYTCEQYGVLLLGRNGRLWPKVLKYHILRRSEDVY